MNATEHIAAFTAHVKTINKSFKLAKSSLKPIFDHLDSTKARPRGLDLETLKGMMTKGDDKKDKYDAAIRELVRVWSTSTDYDAAHVDAPPRGAPRGGSGGGQDAFAFVNRVARQLNAFKDYMSADMFMNTTWSKTEPKMPNWKTGFAGCVNAAKRDEYLAKYRIYKENAPPGSPMMPPRPGTGWKAPQYRMVYQEIDRNKAAICTQFALGAAHLLTTGQDTGPKVEIVAFDNHVYVLVGRTGAAPVGNKIPDDWFAQKDIVIVDGWAGAMGWEVIYKGTKNYPYTGMVKGLDYIAHWPTDE